MDLKEYLLQSSRSASHNFNPEKVKFHTLHGIIGIATESGELLDAVKKSFFYGGNTDFDLANIREEIGDVMWYIMEIMRSEGWDLEEIMDENINKLRLRYPEQFTPEFAQQRLDKE